MTELSENGNSSDEAPTVETTGVVTTTDIPAMVKTGPYIGQFEFGRKVAEDVNVKHILEVSYRHERISMEVDSSNQWLRYIQAARDRHEQNVEFFRAEDRRIFLQTIRKVKMGEQLFAWFSDPLAREMGIPFLTLQNIQGNQCYVCGGCNQSFKYPNPLKSHMRFCCEAIVTPALPATLYSNRIFRPFQDENLRTIEHDRKIPKYSPSTSCNRHNVSRASAFHKPQFTRSQNIQQNPAMISANSSSIITSKVPNLLQFFNHGSSPLFQQSKTFCNFTNYPYVSPYLYSPSSLPSPLEYRKSQLTHPQSCRSAASSSPNITTSFPLPSEVEGEPLDLLPKSFFANKSRKGHLCIYCGKLYSRKYGLKIHLRTHTGYKPLKCKVCLRPFGDPSNLNKHVRLHAEGETPYRCEFCGKVLVRRRDLERHLKSRHSEQDLESRKGKDIVVEEGGVNCEDDSNIEITVV